MSEPIVIKKVANGFIVEIQPYYDSCVSRPVKSTEEISVFETMEHLTEFVKTHFETESPLACTRHA